MDAALAAIEADAREFGLHDRQGPWRLGLLVARSVIPASHGGDRKSSSFARNLNGKVRASEFAHLSGTTTKRVMKHLRAWNRAAKEGHVPPSTDLEPGQELNTLLVDRLPDWSQFYEVETKRKEVAEPQYHWPTASESGEPESETMPWNSAACSIPKASERIKLLELSIAVLLAGKVYRLNAADLDRVRTILLEGLEKVDEYKPIKAKRSRTIDSQPEGEGQDQESEQVPHRS